MSFGKEFYHRSLANFKGAVDAFEKKVAQSTKIPNPQDLAKRVHAVYEKADLKGDQESQLSRSYFSDLALDIKRIHFAPRGERVKDPQLEQFKDLAFRTAMAAAKLVGHGEDCQKLAPLDLVYEPWAQEAFHLLLLSKDKWAVDIFIQELVEGTPFGLDTVLNCEEMYGSLSRFTEALYNHIIDQAIGSEPLQLTLQSLSVLLEEGSSLNHVLTPRLQEFDGKRGLPEDPSRWSLRAENLIESFLAPGLTSLRWKDMSLHYKVTFFRSYFTRQRELIRFYRGELRTDEYLDPPQSKCFPQVDTLLMTICKDTGDVTRYVAEAIKGSGTRLHVFPGDPYREEIEEIQEAHDHVVATYSPSQLDFWFQDYLSVFKGGLRIPPVFLELDFYEDQLIQCRNRRMRDRLGEENFDPFNVFGSYGTSFEEYNNLVLFEKLYTLDDTCTNLIMQFTPIEGGLCLISKDRVFVGKDLLEYTKMLLEQELIELAVMQEGDQLSLEQIKQLIALDFGFESPERVVFIEQPNYHLDVSCMIVDDRGDQPVVLVNDSVQAFKEMCQYVEENEQIETTLEDEEYRVMTYAEKVKELEDEAKVLKQYEDAAAKDFEDAGCRVIRIGGKTKNPNRRFSHNFQVNLFNFSSFISPSGQRLVLAPGANPYFQSKLIDLIREHAGEDVKVIFSSEEIGMGLLSTDGAINCCIKRIGPSNLYEGI